MLRQGSFHKLGDISFTEAHILKPIRDPETLEVTDHRVGQKFPNAKQVAKTSLDLDQDTALNRMDTLDRVKALRLSEDYTEGPQAFTEKRKPVWTGKLRREYFGKGI